MRSLWQRMLTVDLRSLALFRICLGLMLLLDIALRLPDFTFFLTDYGPLPLQALVEDTLTGQTGFSLYFLSGFAFWPYLLMGLTTLLAVALTVGWRVRLVCPLLWLLSLSLQSRAPLVLNSSDRLFLSFLFLGCFLPWDQVWAVGKPRRLPAEQCRVYHPAAAALVGQLLVMYWMAFQFKLIPSWVGDGSALYTTLLSQQYARGSWALQYPDLCRYLAYATVFWEGFGPVLLLATNQTARLIAILVFALFHLGTGLLLNIGLFPLVCLLGLIAWLPSKVWRDGADAEVRPLQTTTTQRVIISLGFALLVTGNLAQLIISDYNGSQLRKICALTGFEQRWQLFAPPRTSDVWYVAVAEYVGGAQRDLLHPGVEQPAFFLKPASLQEESHRRRQYYIALEHGARSGLRRWLAYYLYRSELAKLSGEGRSDQLLRVRITQCQQENKPGFPDIPVTRQPFSEWPPPAANQPFVAP